MSLLAVPLAPTAKPVVYVPPASQTVSPGWTHDQLIWFRSVHVVPAEAQELVRVPGAPLATYQLFPVTPSGGPPPPALASAPPSARSPESALVPASDAGLAPPSSDPRSE